MKKFIPFDKLSKQKQKEMNKAKRGTWGEMNPVTRKAQNPKAYNRKKAQRMKEDDTSLSAEFFYSSDF